MARPAFRKSSERGGYKEEKEPTVPWETRQGQGQTESAIPTSQNQGNRNKLQTAMPGYMCTNHCYIKTSINCALSQQGYALRAWASPVQYLIITVISVCIAMVYIVRRSVLYPASRVVFVPPFELARLAWLPSESARVTLIICDGLWEKRAYWIFHVWCIFDKVYHRANPPVS